MHKETLHQIAIAEQFDEASIQVTQVEGGFTANAKYLVEGTAPDDTLTNVFAKVIDAASPEAVILDTEAEVYQILTELGLTGSYFPQYRGYIRTEAERVLLVDYLPDVSWGGPWNGTNIEKLHHSIDAVHNAAMTEVQVEKVKQTAQHLLEKLGPDPAAMLDPEKDQFFQAAWRLADGTFVNSKGETYFGPVEPTSIDSLVTAADSYDLTQPPKLILKDLNFGNLAVSGDRVYFVDPVYLDIGNPTSDLAVLGINILKTFPSDSPLCDLVKNTFLQDKAALAYQLKYWVACTSLPRTDPDDAWMKFQESCAVKALTVWQELNA
jgi:fructosamine-3-kinase